MAASRTPGTGTPHRDQVGWPAGAVPHGYDQCEFSPEQCTRDFARPRRPREADEERRQLRMADAAIGEGQSESAGGNVDEKWDAEDGPSVNGASRLYRD